jgi:hypothetical protein
MLTGCGGCQDLPERTHVVAIVNSATAGSANSANTLFVLMILSSACLFVADRRQLTRLTAESKPDSRSGHRIGRGHEKVARFSRLRLLCHDPGVEARNHAKKSNEAATPK